MRQRIREILFALTGDTELLQKQVIFWLIVLFLSSCQDWKRKYDLNYIEILYEYVHFTPLCDFNAFPGLCIQTAHAAFTCMRAFRSLSLDQRAASQVLVDRVCCGLLATSPGRKRRLCNWRRGCHRTTRGRLGQTGHTAVPWRWIWDW